MDAHAVRNDVRVVTDWDLAVAAELRRLREEARLSRETVCMRIVGLHPSALQKIEQGFTRVTMGVLHELCRVIGVPVRAVMVRAGLENEEVPVAELLATDGRLDPLARQIVAAAYQLALAQAAWRRGEGEAAAN